MEGPSKRAEINKTGKTCDLHPSQVGALGTLPLQRIHRLMHRVNSNTSIWSHEPLPSGNQTCQLNIFRKRTIYNWGDCSLTFFWSANIIFRGVNQLSIMLNLHLASFRRSKGAPQSLTRAINAAGRQTSSWSWRGIPVSAWPGSRAQRLACLLRCQTARKKYGKSPWPKLRFIWEILCTWRFIAGKLIELQWGICPTPFLITGGYPGGKHCRKRW